MNNHKILVVDDEPNVLKFIADTLQTYDLIMETSSFKAIEIMQIDRFDIFIVDYQMPQINGIELLEEIKRINLGRHYMSIFCTAYGTIHLFKTELVEGLYDFYVEKPINSDILLQTVQRAVISLERIRSIEKPAIKSLC